MIQPHYSPQEALDKIKLMMKYDSSKTLNENKKIVSEQYVAPAAAATAAGAGIGAGIGAALPTSVAIGAAGTGAVGTGVASGVVYSTAGALGVGLGTAGAIVGGAAALAVLPLVYWLVTKDTGANKVKKMFEMCSSEATKIAKLPRKMNDMAFRDMSDSIDDAINDTTFGIKGGTDEEKLFAQFKKLQDGTASDFCAFVKYYNSHSDSGDLFDDLDSDIDAEDEWKQIYRPIRNCVEDSLLSMSDDTNVKKAGSGKGSGKAKYKMCSETFPIAMNCKNSTIARVQGCIGVTQDGAFGPITSQALVAKGVDGQSITEDSLNKVCGSKTETQPDPSDVLPDDFNGQSGINATSTNTPAGDTNL